MSAGLQKERQNNQVYYVEIIIYIGLVKITSNINKLLQKSVAEEGWLVGVEELIKSSKHKCQFKA